MVIKINPCISIVLFVTMVKIFLIIVEVEFCGNSPFSNLFQIGINNSSKKKDLLLTNNLVCIISKH